jgi:hypothetical protein
MGRNYKSFYLKRPGEKGFVTEVPHAGLLENNLPSEAASVTERDFARP